jgi:pyroglutamyl-peptidase
MDLRKTTDGPAPRVLVAGFEPFENDPVNPAWEIARALDGWTCEGATVQAVQLPCVFGRAIDTLDAALAGSPPQLVLCLGAAGGRTEISMERAALNIDDARIPDNVGQQPIDLPRGQGRPGGLLHDAADQGHGARHARGGPARGRVEQCRHFRVQPHLLRADASARDASGAGARARRLHHVPYLPEQAESKPGVASMALSTQVDAMRVAIRTALTVRNDVRETAGRLH